MAEHASWNRTRASIVPMTMVFALFYLWGFLDNFSYNDNIYLEIGIWSIIPGAFIGLIIRFKTKYNQAPDFLITIYAVCSFVMSIVWIKFSSDCIMDLL